MNSRERQDAFFKRWEVSYDPKKSFDEFKSRVAHAVSSSIPSLQALIYKQGHPLHRKISMVFGAAHRGWSLEQLITEAPDYRQLAIVLERLFWAIRDAGNAGSSDTFIAGLGFRQSLKEAIDYSAAIGFEMVDDGNVATFYPAGAKFLDEQVVSQTLAWMRDCPAALKNFEEALSLYLDGDRARYRNLLDNLHLSLEELLRFVLHNDKSLENQKEMLLSWLRERGLHSQIANMYHRLLFGEFATYQNECVKHHDRWTPAEVEFLIYQTGVFARLLLQLHRDTSAGSDPVSR